jgi:hypothetical protein
VAEEGQGKNKVVQQVNPAPKDAANVVANTATNVTGNIANNAANAVDAQQNAVANAG